MTVAANVFEIFVFAAAIYAFIRFLQETQGSAVFKGFVIMVALTVVGLPLVSRLLSLEHLQFVTDKGLSLIMIGLIVIFSPELRHAMVKLGDAVWPQKTKGAEDVPEDQIIQAAERLSRRGYGALMVIEREVGIASFTEGGVRLDAVLTAPLLVSIFFKDTPLHDGAVIIRGRRVVAAGCVLPLSENPNLPKTLGTRHRAAIGATEENDAIAIVVSEETRQMSLVERGTIRQGLKREELLAALSGQDDPLDVDLEEEA